MSNSLWPLAWFIAIVAMIPVALWLFKRSPLGRHYGGAAGGHTLRTVGMLALSPHQRVVTVEVGDGDERRWLVLGVTAQQITTLHSMPPQAAPAAALPGTTTAPPFAQLLGALRRGGPGAGDA